MHTCVSFKYVHDILPLNTKKYIDSPVTMFLLQVQKRPKEPCHILPLTLIPAVREALIETLI